MGDAPHIGNGGATGNLNLQGLIGQLNGEYVGSVLQCVDSFQMGLHGGKAIFPDLVFEIVVKVPCKGLKIVNDRGFAKMAAEIRYGLVHAVVELPVKVLVLSGHGGP